MRITKAQTIKALKDSIRKWRGIIAGTMVDRGMDNCALCQLFAAVECAGCPVNPDNRCECCHNTPYAQWCIVAKRTINGNMIPTNIRNPNRLAAQKAAEAKLKFLEGLLAAELKGRK